MLLEKYGNVFELSLKQLVIKSSLASSISLGQTVNVTYSKVRYYIINPNPYLKGCTSRFLPIIPINVYKK